MTFLKDRLFGEGDFMRHLASKGYKLHYQQDPRAEFEFGVTNLAIDLRNGMRLCKLVEQLTGRHRRHADRRCMPVPLAHFPGAVIGIMTSRLGIICPYGQSLKSADSSPRLSARLGMLAKSSMDAGEPGLVASTHFPADRRPQQIQNVDAALLALEEAGCRIDTAAEDIVNGVRDKTLGLLWTLIHQQQACFRLSPASLLSIRHARQ